MQLKKLISNLASGWLYTLLTGLIAILMIPFLLKEMGSDYASVVLFLSFGSLINLADFGIGGSLTREITAAITSNQNDRVCRITSSGFLLYIVLALIVIAFCLMMTPFLLNWFWLEDQDSRLIPLIIYLCTWVTVTFLSQSWIAVIFAHQRYDIVNGIRMISLLGSVAAQLTIIPVATDKVLAWTLIAIIVPIISSVVLLMIAGKMNSNFSLGFRFVDWDEMKNIMGFSSRVTLLQATRVLSEKFDPMILAAHSTPLSVILYNSAGKLPSASRPFITTIAQQLCPRATQLHVGGKSLQLQEILIVGTRYSMLLGTGAFVAIVFLCTDFAFLWLGRELPESWIEVSHLMIGLAIIDLMTYAAGGTQWSILFGLRKLDFLIYTMLPTAIVNLALSIYFVSSTELGALGVIVATLGISIIRRPIIIYYTSRLVDLSVWEYLKKSYVGPFLVLTLTSLVALLVVKLPLPLSWSSLSLKGFLIFCAWMSLVWLMGVSRSEKEHLLRSAGKMTKKLKL